MATMRASLRSHALSSPSRFLVARTLPHTPRRHDSTSATSFENLKTSLPARKLPIVWDYLVPTPNHLLNIALDDILPPQPASTNAPPPPTGDEPRVLPSIAKPAALPHTHHLIYFPPPIPGVDLLPDGTDPLQSPGAPFVRRMWAGGAAHFNLSSGAAALTALDGTRAACMESIRDVAVKGPPGAEKIFVGIERRIGRVPEHSTDHDVRQRFWRPDEADFGDAVGVIERRNIVFMRERSPEQAKAELARAKAKQMAPPTLEPLISHDVYPDARLLFRYSALTYNAHAIHLDPEFCRDVEGHRGLLVHGPLSFTLLVSLLRRHLASEGHGEDVAKIEYRNLAPLYAGERLRLCGRRTKEVGEEGDAQGRWEVWAETPEGGVAVNAKIWTQVVAR